MVYNSHLTAISRKALPVPVRWLLSQGMIKGDVLDFGCGKCKELNDIILAKHSLVKSVTSYDPYYHPDPKLYREYDVILCTYVLCTLPKGDDLDVLRTIQRRLRKNGIAFITVRADEPKAGYGRSSKGTFQRKVEIPYLHELRKTSQYRTYVLTKTSEVPII